jgi:hypothetical protein
MRDHWVRRLVVLLSVSPMLFVLLTCFTRGSATAGPFLGQATYVAATTTRTPTSGDVAQLTALIGRPQAKISCIAIVGNFAEACWFSGNIGGAILATNVSGAWQQVDAVHGGYSAADITARAPSIPAGTASQLASQAALNQVPTPLPWMPFTLAQVPNNSATDISADADGNAYYIGTPIPNVPAGESEVYWIDSRGDFSDLHFTAAHITAGVHGDPWVIKANSLIYHYVNGSWQWVPSNQATEISAGFDGYLYYVGTAIPNTPPGESEVYKVDSHGNFQDLKFTAAHIAGGVDGDPWVLKAGGAIYHYQLGSWQLVPGNQATRISVGADGSVYYVGTPVPNTPPGENHTYWMDTKGDFEDLGKLGDHIAGGNNRNIWLLNSENIFYGVH